MKRTLVVLLLAVAATGCSDDDAFKLNTGLKDKPREIGVNLDNLSGEEAGRIRKLEVDYKLKHSQMKGDFATEIESLEEAFSKLSGEFNDNCMGPLRMKDTPECQKLKDKALSVDGRIRMTHKSYGNKLTALEQGYVNSLNSTP